ncbi:hypothetical protein CBR_g45624 [Chara braunii]|uniref:Uncharacterized protein n=1 Tax=Chara braunii TaxID=69332 RepID=A0A388LZ39_CHABU|nr:hypothetical protein CBR_g45624 [Chara braunii]|eukprot:GBG87566.1 hypothetical protein CBR_g45624 [Chara braunii]
MEGSRDRGREVGIDVGVSVEGGRGREVGGGGQSRDVGGGRSQLLKSRDRGSRGRGREVTEVAIGEGKRGGDRGRKGWDPDREVAIGGGERGGDRGREGRDPGTEVAIGGSMKRRDRRREGRDPGREVVIGGSIRRDGEMGSEMRGSGEQEVGGGRWGEEGRGREVAIGMVVGMGRELREVMGGGSVEGGKLGWERGSGNGVRWKEVGAVKSGEGGRLTEISGEK